MKNPVLCTGKLPISVSAARPKNFAKNQEVNNNNRQCATLSLKSLKLVARRCLCLALIEDRVIICPAFGRRHSATPCFSGVDTQPQTTYRVHKQNVAHSCGAKAAKQVGGMEANTVLVDNDGLSSSVFATSPLFTNINAHTLRNKQCPDHNPQNK